MSNRKLFAVVFAGLFLAACDDGGNGGDCSNVSPETRLIPSSSFTEDAVLERGAEPTTLPHATVRETLVVDRQNDIVEVHYTFENQSYVERWRIASTTFAEY